MNKKIIIGFGLLGLIFIAIGIYILFFQESIKYSKCLRMNEKNPCVIEKCNYEKKVTAKTISNFATCIENNKYNPQEETNQQDTQQNTVIIKEVTS